MYEPGILVSPEVWQHVVMRKRSPDKRLPDEELVVEMLTWIMTVAPTDYVYLLCERRGDAIA